MFRTFDEHSQAINSLNLPRRIAYAQKFLFRVIRGTTPEFVYKAIENAITRELATDDKSGLGPTEKTRSSFYSVHPTPKHETVGTLEALRSPAMLIGYIEALHQTTLTDAAKSLIHRRHIWATVSHKTCKVSGTEKVIGVFVIGDGAQLHFFWYPIEGFEGPSPGTAP